MFHLGYRKGIQFGGIITPYSPSDQPSLKQWLESTTLAGSVGSSLANWPDSSGNSHPAVQATGANQPTVQANTSDGQKTVRFVDGNPSFMVVANHVDLVGTGGYTQIFVASKPNVTPSGAILWKDNGSGVAYQWQYDESSQSIFHVQGGTSILAITKYVPGRLHMGMARLTGGTARQTYGDGFPNLSDTVSAATSTGDNFLGTTPNLSADISTFRHFNTALDDSSIANEMSYEAKRHSGHNLTCLGDSETEATYTFNTYPAQFNLLITSGMLYVRNSGVAGQTTADAITNIQTQAAQWVLFGWPYNVASVWIGTNDIFFGASGATTIARFITYCTMLRTAGYNLIIVQPILPRSDAGTPVDFWTQAMIFNNWLAANWQTIADAYFDNNNTALVVGGNTLNPIYNFNSDGVHLNDAGLAIIAAGIQTAYGTLA